MKCYFNYQLVIICGILIISCQNEIKTETIYLKNTLAFAKGGEYLAPSEIELYKADILFIRTLKGEKTVALQKAWQIQGFTMRMDTKFTIVQDNKGTGQGFYIFRHKNSQAIALQAPHSYTDLYTGEIARKLMQESNYVAAAWNTVPRDVADMAHLENTIFQAFGRAFAQQYPTGLIVQLHGFAKKKRKSKKGQNTDLIISGTTKTPSVPLLNSSHCLKSQLIEFEIRLYPFEINELGGTTNSNAKDLRKREFYHFFHIEMSKPLRKVLRHNRQKRDILNHCLQMPNH